MEKKNVIFNHTLEQYNKKYKNRKHRLVKFTKSQVEEFDRLHKTSNNYLLKDRKWWFIDGVYYEIPKAPRYTWFRNLNAGIQTGVCVLGAGVVATAVVVPTILLKQNDKGDVIIEPTKQEEAEIKVESKTADGTIYKISPKDSSKKKVSAIESVYIGNDKLEEVKEYTTEQVDESIKLTIKQVAFDNHKGQVKVNPKVEEKSPIVPTIDNLAIDVSAVKKHKVGDTLDLTGISILAHYTDSSTEIVDKNNVTFNPAEGTSLSTIGINKITVTYKGFNKEFEINVEDKVSYDIDWKTTSFDLGDGIAKTLYEYATTATKIEFVEDSTVGSVCVGETANDLIYASFTTVDTVKTLKVWSSKKIVFQNNDVYGDLGFFGNCKVVTSFNLSNIDTSNVTKFSGCFSNCVKLEELDLSNFNTNSATTMDCMFYNCKILTSLNLNSFNTSSVTNMGKMFCYCRKLTSLNLNSFNTSNVNDMSLMFQDCNSLTSLDLSSFNTSNVHNMSYMFNCKKLITICVSNNFVTDNVSSSGEMFTSNTELVGGYGTKYNIDKTNKEYARLDDPNNDKPGYFSAKRTFNINYADNLISQLKDFHNITVKTAECTSQIITGEVGKIKIVYDSTGQDENIDLHISYNDGSWHTIQDPKAVHFSIGTNQTAEFVFTNWNIAPNGTTIKVDIGGD